jgi:hypothetical protein
MAWTDLSAEFYFGDRVFETKIKQIHDNFTAVCSGSSSTPKFKNRAFSHGPAVGKNAVKTLMSSLDVGSVTLNVEENFNVGSFAFFPSIRTNFMQTCVHLSFAMCVSPSSIVIAVYAPVNSTKHIFIGTRNLDY